MFVNEWECNPGPEMSGAALVFRFVVIPVLVAFSFAGLQQISIIREQQQELDKLRKTELKFEEIKQSEPASSKKQIVVTLTNEESYIIEFDEDKVEEGATLSKLRRLK